MRALFLTSLTALAWVLLAPVSASAQAIVQNEIVVPTISTFTVGTTVSVPDRGGMLLGGSRSASTIRNEFGPGFGRGLSSRAAASDATVRVWVHDFQELEESLGKSSDSDAEPLSGFAAGLRHYASRRQSPGADRAATSTAPTREVDAVERKAREAADLLARGQDAESRGKRNIARLYYKSVLALGSTPSARTAQSQLDTIDAIRDHPVSSRQLSQQAPTRLSADANQPERPAR